MPTVRCSRLDACVWLTIAVHFIPEVTVADEKIFGLGSWSLNLTGFEDYKTPLLGFYLQKHVEVKSLGSDGMGRYGNEWKGRGLVGRQWVPAAFIACKRKCYMGLL